MTTPDNSSQKPKLAHQLAGFGSPEIDPVTQFVVGLAEAGGGIYLGVQPPLENIVNYLGIVIAADGLRRMGTQLWRTRIRK